MRLSQTPPTLISLLLTVLSRTHLTKATPFPRDELDDLGFGYLEERGCYGYCGEQRWCCSVAGETACSTDTKQIIYCVAPTADSNVDAGSGVVVTTTWTSTDLVAYTSTYTSYNAVGSAVIASVTVPPGVSLACNPGEQLCGNICCASTQTCASAGQCAAASSGLGAQPFVAPLLVTGGTTIATATSSVTTTRPFSSPTAASATSSGTGLAVSSSSNSGLSGGAIAGIVIGVIAGIILFLLICFCCCLRAGFHGVMGLLGLGKRRDKKKRTETIVTEEKYSSRHSGAAARKTHRNWFGRPTRPGQKKSSGLGGFGAIGAGLLGLAVILGLKRRDDAKKKPARPPPPSDVSSNYYTDYYTETSASSESSDDRRTRGTRASRISRNSRRR